MEVYVLDSLLRRTSVFDVFESMIWTERFVDSGDFELHIQSSFDTRSQFANGVRIAINESYRVMTVETVEDTTDSDGKAMLKITGHSLENLLKDRVAEMDPSTILDLTSHPTWDITDTPSNIARTMVLDICRGPYTTDSSLSVDAIPYLGVSRASGVGWDGPTAGSPPDFSSANQATWVWKGTFVDDIFSPGTLPEPADEINWYQDVTQDLFSAVANICKLYDFGFRIVRDSDNSRLIFNIYTGNDRTTRQTDLPPVVFAPNLENLQNTTEFQTIDQSKNVAYVYHNIATGDSDRMGRIVFGEGVDPEVTGFDRRVMSVDASSEVNDTMTTTELHNVLDRVGRLALNQNRTQSYFDGELSQESSAYKYGVDYLMGDLVELRNVDGVITYKRVTEQIFVSDNQGDRSYPTLAIDEFIGLNTWLSYGNKTIQWIDFDSEATAWEDM